MECSVLLKKRFAHCCSNTLVFWERFAPCFLVS